jgi:thiamine kinase-like enzyme
MLLLQLWLIDYDYAAAGDIFFDLANFSSNCELSFEDDKIILECYFGQATRPLMARLQIYKIMSNLRESLWSYVQWGISKTCSQEFYDEYAIKLMDRVRASIASGECDQWIAALAEGKKSA